MSLPHGGWRRRAIHSLPETRKRKQILTKQKNKEIAPTP
jgi:hypothetical protein